VAVRLGPTGVERLAEVLRDRRFRLGALPGPMRPGAVAVLVVIIAWSVVIARNAAGAGVTADVLGETSFGVMGVPGWGPPAVRVGTVVALGIAVVVVTGAATAAGWPEGRATRVVRRGILAGAGLAGLALVTRASLDADTLWAELLTDPAAPVGPARWVAAVRVVAAKGLVWAGVAAALALPFAPLAGGWGRRAAVALAAAPFLAYLLATAIAGDLGVAWLANADYRDDRLYNVAGGLELVLVLYVVWELTTWTGFVSDLAASGARARRVGRAVVAGLLAAKLAWLGLGLAGRLPGVLGGSAGVWGRMRGDGAGSWLTAAVLAGVLLACLAVAPRVVDPRPVAVAEGTAFLLVTLLCLPGLAAGVLLGLYRSVRDLTPAGPFDLAARVALLLAVAVLAGGLLAVRAGEGRGRPPGSWLAVVALGAAALLGTLVGAAVLTELIQRTEDVRAAATAWGRPPGGRVVPGGAGRRRRRPLLPRPRPGLRGRPGPRAGGPAPGPGRAHGGGVRPRPGRGGPAVHHPPGRPGPPPPRPAGPGRDRRPARAPVRPPGLPPGRARLGAVVAWPGRRVRAGRAGRPADRGTVRAGPVVVAPQGSRLAGDGAVRAARLDRAGALGDPGPDRLDRAPLVLPGPAVPAGRPVPGPGRRAQETAARRPELVLLSLAAIALLLTLLGYRLLIGALDPTVDLENAMFGYTRGFTVELILLPLGLAAVALRLRRPEQA